MTHSANNNTSSPDFQMSVTFPSTSLQSTDEVVNEPLDRPKFDFNDLLLLHAKEFESSILEKIDLLRKEYDDLTQLVDDKVQKENMPPSTDPDVSPAVVQAHTAGFIRASLFFLSEEYKREEIRSYDVSRIQEFVQTWMQTQTALDNVSEAQEHMRHAIHEFIKNGLASDDQDRKAEASCARLESTLGVEKSKDEEMKILRQMIASDSKKHLLNQTRMLQERLELWSIKKEIARAICLKIASDQQKGKEVAHALADLNKQKQDVENHRLELEQEKSSLDQLKTTLQNQQAELSQERSAFDNQRLEDQVRVEQKTTLENEKTRLGQERAALNDEITAFEAQKSCLEEEKAELQESKAVFECEKSDFEKEKTGIQDQATGLNTEKERIEKEKDSLDEQRLKLEEEKETLEKNKLSLSDQKKDLESERAVLIKELSTLNTQKDAFEQEKANLEKEKKEQADTSQKEAGSEEIEKDTELAKEELKKYTKLVQECKEKHTLELKAHEALMETQKDRLEQAKAENEYIRIAREEIKILSRECRQPVRGSKRKAFEYVSDESETEVVETKPVAKRTRTRPSRAAKNEPEVKDEPVHEAGSVDETETAEAVPTIEDLLQKKDSLLSEVNMKDLILSTLSELTEKEKGELAAYLPQPDLVKSGEISEEFLTRGNNVFWESAETWQALLSAGSFDPNFRPKGSSDEDKSFKDDQYEQYWGEKVAKANAQKNRRKSSRRQ